MTTLPLTMCITNMRPEYAKYFHSLGLGKQRELCVLSKCLEFRNMIASQIPIKSFPKWILRQFLNVSSQVLLKRIAIVLKDAQLEVPIFQGDQNVQHQPASGLFPPWHASRPYDYTRWKPLSGPPSSQPGTPDWKGTKGLPSSARLLQPLRAVSSC